MMVADFGGRHKGQYFDTYAFLVFDLDRNERWLHGQRIFRQAVMPNRRRMAFKSMNDKFRHRALLPFLQLADEIDGWLVLFAISKAGGSAFRSTDRTDDVEELLKIWKPNVREELLRIVHFSAFLLSGFSSLGQNILWIIDKDEVAANVRQLTQLTKILTHVLSNSIGHDLRNLRCGTTQSDDGSMSLEDLVAICDLGAGTLCEVATAMNSQGRTPVRNIMTMLPAGLTWKSRSVASWLAADIGSLKRLTCLIELSATSSGMRSTMMRWHATAGRVLLPEYAYP